MAFRRFRKAYNNIKIYMPKSRRRRGFNRRPRRKNTLTWVLVAIAGVAGIFFLWPKIKAMIVK